MSKNFNRLIPLLTGTVLLAGGIIACVLFIKTKPEAKRRAPMSSMVPVVETMPLEFSSQALYVDCLGTVIADKSVSIQAEVSGRIIEVNPDLVEGARLKKGDLLIKIEPADYELALANAEADLLTAQSNYRIEEGQQDVVRNELELMGSDESDSYRDLMLREPQLKAAEAAVKSAQLAVESAKLDLARTTIRAPFDAVVVAADADVGSYAQLSKSLLTLAATDRYFIRASVPLSALEPLPNLGHSPYAATVTLSDDSTCPAQTYRLLPDLSETGRMARILLSVGNPLENGGRPLLLNEYVRVRIAGETVENATLIPRKYLRDGQVVWMLDSENKLRVLQAELLQGYSNDVLIRVDVTPDMELITTDLSVSVDGAALRRVGDPVAPKDAAGEGNAPDMKKQEA
jgi:RND family efflux transporter MFP subunit